MTDRGILGSLHPFLKLLLLIILMLGSLLLITFAGLLIAFPFFGTDILNQLDKVAENLDLLRYIQLLSHIGLFVVPAIVFGWLVGKNPMHYYSAKHVPGLKAIAISALIMIVAVPFVYYLMQVNQQLSLPESMSGIEDWMRRSEDEAEKMMVRLLNVSSLQAYLFNIFLIAVIPGIGEELIFRGVIQRTLGQWTKSLHVAVIVSAILLSAMHMQFFSFLPRLALGVTLGYMFVITGNIWVPIFAHFFNNAAAVTLYFVVYNNERYNSETLAAPDIPAVLIVVSLAMVVFLFYFLTRKKAKSHDVIS